MSNDYEQHKLLKEKGIDILILDHHLSDSYSEYAVVVNNQLSDHYTNKKLCGAGVVYKFLNYFDKTYGYNNAKKFLDLCALANIADCMSMSDLETRYYIVEGLKNINNGCFKSLIESQSYSLFQTSKELNYIKIAFYIAPLINAMVRVGTETEKNELFESFVYPEKLIQSTKRGAQIGELIPISEEIARKAINAKNRQNRLKEKAIDIIDMRIQKEGLLDNKIIIAEIYEEDKIPQELTGLLATHFVNKYNRPCIIVRKNDEGFLRGSIRGNDTFEEVPDLKEFLKNSGVTEYVQGHSNAAGISFQEKFLDNLLEYSNTNISEEGLKSCYIVDYIFNYSEFIAPIIMSVSDNPSLWGNDIKEPTAVVEKIPLDIDSFTIMGPNRDCVKFTNRGVEFIKFKDKNFIKDLQKYRRFDITVYGKFNQNVWQGRKSPQFIIEDYEIINTEDDF